MSRNIPREIAHVLFGQNVQVLIVTKSGKILRGKIVGYWNSAGLRISVLNKDGEHEVEVDEIVDLRWNRVLAKIRRGISNFSWRSRVLLQKVFRA